MQTSKTMAEELGLSHSEYVNIYAAASTENGMMLFLVLYPNKFLLKSEIKEVTTIRDFDNEFRHQMKYLMNAKLVEKTSTQEGEKYKHTDLGYKVVELLKKGKFLISNKTKI